MRVTEIIEDLERHVMKYGGEEVTKNVSTRDLLAALKIAGVEAEVNLMAQLLHEWYIGSGVPMEFRSYLRGLAAWLVAKGVREQKDG